MPLHFLEFYLKKETVAMANMNPRNLTKDLGLNDVVLRRAESRDVDKIREVLKQAFRGLEGRGYSAQAIETAIVDAEEIKKRISLGAHVIVAELRNEIVGTVTGFEEHKSMHVCSLAVHPKYQNRGVAHQLMLHLEKTAHQKRCQKLFLCTAWAMKEAIRLYENLGYVKEGYLRNHFYGEDFIIFGKFIKRSQKRDSVQETFLNH